MERGPAPDSYGNNPRTQNTCERRACRKRVRIDQSGHSCRPVHVRCASKSDRIAAPERNDAMCQKPTSPSFNQVVGASDQQVARMERSAIRGATEKSVRRSWISLCSIQATIDCGT